VAIDGERSVERPTEVLTMLEIECPWCAESGPLPLDEAQPLPEFTCDDCGTTILFEDDVTERMPLAA
jgi:hypothetical protein